MRILVTGGAGMLGSATILALKRAGHAVKSFDLDLSPAAPQDSLIGDIRQRDSLTYACSGMDAVIHTVAMINQSTTRPTAMFEVNVTGTRNVIAACQAMNVPRLLYTSSIDVVFDGTPIRDGDERLPYPERHLDFYGETKMLAEMAILEANSVGGVAMCSLRAAGLYGAGDRHRFPNILPRTIQSGRYTTIGDGRSKFTHTYVENMAYAFVLAVERLHRDSPLAGQAYFITDYAPSNFWAFFRPYLDALRIRYGEQRLPERLAMALAQAAEWAHERHIGGAPLLSRYAVAATAHDFWFNHRKAARDLGYAPVVSEGEAFARTLAWARATFLKEIPTTIRA
jgi:sterol-4alpha-carboxylate 3-dehydrogenase (decarboxylating)